MRFPELNHRKKGFTLTELLIVVAIIGILLAVAVPNVLAYYKELKITELDDSARTIFVAAQNRLTALINAGEDLSGVGTKIAYPAGATGKPDLNYIQNNSASITSLHNILPAGSVDTQLQDNNFVIEFNPQSGAVYAVWYWEKYDFHYNSSDPDANPTEKNDRVKNGKMVGYYGGENIDRLTAGQMPFPSVKLINAEELRVEITVPNSTTVPLTDNHIRVDVSVNGELILKDANIWQEKTGTVVLDTLKLPGAGKDSPYPLEDIAGKGNSGWIYGNKFKNLKAYDPASPSATEPTESLKTVPGDDITVSVKLYYNGTLANGTTPLPQTVTVTTNSLFEKVTEESGGTKIAHIAYGRHLQNLHDSANYSVTGGVFCSGVVFNEKITKALQTKNIDFSVKNTSGDPAKDVYYWGSMYNDAPASYTSANEFHPIANKNLTEFDGGSYEIRNMVAGSEGRGGLFSYVAYGNSLVLKRITLVNPQIHSGTSSSAAAGGLVAMAEGTIKIDECAVYSDCDFTSLELDDLVTSGSAPNHVEKLKGYPHIGAPEEGSSLGGFVGLATGNVTILNSHVSMILVGAGFTGGLIGNNSGTAIIQNSYSADFIYSNRKTGGLVGFISSGGSVEISNCYATGVVKKGYSAFVCAGLAYSDDPSIIITATNSYVAIKYIGEDINGRPAQESDGSLTGTIYGTYQNDNSGSNYYVPQSGITYGCVLGNTGAETTVGCGESKTTAQLIAMVGTENFAGTEWYVPAEVGGKRLNPAGVTNPYRLIKELKSDSSLTIPYPYPMLKSKDGDPVPHYGDWLENKANGVIAYWEKYALDAPDADKASTVSGDGKYGIWGYLDPEKPDELTNTLMNAGDKRDGKHYAIADGYGVLVKDGATPPETVTFTHKDNSSATVECKVAATGITITLDGVTYQLYPIENLDSVPLMGNGTGARTSVTSVYYYRVSLGGKEYLVNPHFACEIAAAEAASEKNPADKIGAKGADDKTTTNGVVIRTARQLAYVSEYTTVAGPRDSAWEWTYRQLLDVDYTKYHEATTSFTKGIDKDHRQSPIDLGKDLSSTGGAYYGNTFQIRNLYIGERTGTLQSYIGVFGSVHGTSQLDGIRLVNVDVDVSTNSVGGLVGEINNNAVINNCGIYCEDQADYDNFTIKGVSYVGGLVGVIAENVKVTDSFAAVKVIGNQTIVGGFVGQIGGNAVITDCYVGGHTVDGEYELDAEDNANVTGNTLVGGFIGHVSVTVSERPYLEGINYTTASVKWRTNANATDGGYFIGGWSGTAVEFNAVLYATGYTYNKNGKITPTKTYEGVKVLTGHGLAEVKKGTAMAYPYDEELMTDKDTKTGTYPYLTAEKNGARVEHHGDWIVVPPEPILAYIEEYSDVTNGVYSIKRDGTSATADLNSLRLGTDGVIVTRDMYRLISEEKLTGYTYALNTGSPQELPEAVEMTIDGIKYYTYDVANSPVTGTNFYNKLTLTAPDTLKEFIFFYNTAFACEAFDMTASSSFGQSSNLFDKPQADGQGTSTSRSHVVIRSARQLANLAEYTTGADINPTIQKSYAQKWKCHQLMPIDFALYKGKTLTGAEIPGKTSGAPLTPAKLTSGKYYGYKYEIRNLFIGPDLDGGVDGTGLFSELGGTVSGVRLVNVSVAGGDSDAIGGLIGRLNGGTVDDCGIYVDLDQQTAISDLGTLYTSKIVRGSGESGVGGLIGQVQSGNVTSSFAAVKVEGTAATNSSSSGNLTNPAGGFVGQINGGTFKNCYVGGYVDATSKTYVDGSVNVKGNNHVGGFVGDIAVGSARFDGINYSTASVYGPDAAKLGLFAGATATGWKNENGVRGWQLYALAKAFTDELDPATGAPTTNKVVTAARDESAYLSNPEIQDPAKADATKTKYNAVANKYPYQTNLSTHYGDWIGLTQGAYYDTTQASGTVAQLTGWYSQGGALSTTGFNTLAPGTAPTGRLYAIDDGYAFLSTVDLGDLAVSVDGVSYPMEREKDTSGKAVTTRIDGKDYFVYYVSAAALNTPTKHYYATVSVNGQLFTANLGLAAEIFNEKTEEAKLDEVREKSGLKTVKKTENSDGSTTATVEELASPYKGGLIRSARQLANLGIRSNKPGDGETVIRGLDYAQLLDIDYTGYTGKDMDGVTSKMPTVGLTSSGYNHVPITLTKDASYNGYGNMIVGLRPGYTILHSDGIAASGLFSRVQEATVENIRIVNPTFAGNKGVANDDPTSTSSLPSIPSPTALGDVHVLDVKEDYGSDIDAGINTDKSSVTSETAKDSFFTLWWNEKGSMDTTRLKEFTDGYSSEYRINFGGQVAAGANAIGFTTSGAAYVKVWWVAAGPNRQMKILNSSGKQVDITKGSTTQNSLYISTLLVTDAGTYYLGGDTGKNYIFRVEVTEVPVNVLEGKKLDAFGTDTKKDGEYSVENQFVLKWSTGSKVDTNSKTFPDGYSSGQRVNFGDKASTEKNSIMFETTGPVSVRIWFVPNETGNEMVILDKSGAEVVRTSENPAARTTDIATIRLENAGIYYLGGATNKNYIFKVAVVGGLIDIDPDDIGGTGPVTPPPYTGDEYDISGYKIRVGALAGVLDNAVVNNCGVYVESESGATYADYDAAYNKFEVENTVAGADNDLVGGLAGNVTGSTVTNSFAAVKVTGVRIVGGFAGRLAAGTVIENCYVGGHTYQGTFFGVPAAPGVEGEGIVNVQATATPASNVSVAVGGFAGEIPLNDKTVTFKGVNYSTASFGVKSVYMGTTSTNATSEASHLNADLTFDDYTTEMGQFIGKVREGAKVQRESGANLYAMGEAFVNGEYVGLTATAEGNGYEKHENDDGYDFKTSGDKDVPYINHKSGDYLNSTALVANVTTTSVQKYDTNLGDNYPYAQAQYIHHGDWTSRYNLIYYEVYSKDDPDITDTSNLKVIPDVCGDNYIGFYAVLRNEDNSEGATINTLSLTGHVIDSGYMVLSDAKVDTMKFSINSTYGGKLATENSVLFQVAGDDPVEFTGTEKDGSGGTVPVTEKYYVYPVPFATINIAPSDTYYQHVTINGQPYMLNQHFACEAINVGLVGTDGKMDYDTVRAKPGVQYNEYVRNNQNEITKTEVKTLTEDDQVIIIRSPWNLAGMARYTRDGNESTHRADARKWTYLQTMDIDYTKYKEGQIYDGNTTNRSEPVRSKWFAGTNYPYGQAPAQLIDGGHFNGNGHIIANLYLSSDSTKKAYVGLFGLISGEGTVVENIYMENLYVNAWGGPDDGIYVGGIAGEIAKGATLRNVSVHNLEMDFHKVPTWDKDNSTYKEGGTTKFKAVGGIVGHLTDGSVSNVYVNSLSIDFGGNTYSYSWTSEKAKDKEGKEKDDYYINGQFANSSSGIKYGSSVHKDQASMSVGGAIGEIDVASGADVSVTDVYVVNPLIKANKGKDNSVGGVVGKAVGNAEIANSGVYHAATTTTTAAEEYGDGGVRATAGTTDDHTDHVGGFAGEVGSGVTVTNSFAAVKVTGKQDVGGFAGHIADATIENCFAGGHTVNGQYETGSGKANVTANNSSNSSGAYAGGFVGSVDNTGGKLAFVGTVYSTASVEGTTDRGAFLGNSTGADAMESVLGASSAPTLYATGISVDAGEDLWDEATEYGLLTGLDVPTGNANADNRYDQTLPGSYPFKNETKVNLDGDPDTPAVAAHFGDWAKAEMVSAIYYEFEGGTYHFYSLRGEIATGKFGTKPIDSLCKEHDGKAITAWGYGYLVPDGVTVTVGGTEITDTALKDALEKEFGVGVKVVAGSTAAMLEPDTWTFTDASGNSISFYVNTAYAAAIEKAEKDTSTSTGLADSTLGTEGNPYQIRTAQQLDNMDGTGRSNPNKNYFEETHDVSGGNGFNYSGINYFGGHFDGQSYRILDLTITTGGLFNEVYGDVVLENIVLYAPANGSITTTSGNAGGLVAATKGTSLTIRNCAVAGYTITAGTGGNAGGLVGSHEAGTLTIEKSEATTTLSGASVGGLVGAVGADAGDVTITDSYAGGKIESASSSAGGVIGSQDTGSTAKITYKNVYSYVNMTSVDKTKQLYGIGPKVDREGKDHLGFWGGGMTNVTETAYDRKLRKSLLNLVDWSDDPDKETASEQTYIPGTDDGLTDKQPTRAFPYKAFVTDWQGEHVHYGDWPEATEYAGLFYWEKEIVFDKDHPEPNSYRTEYHFYAYGAEVIDGNVLESEIVDTLCYSHHTEERASIVDSGYGYFYKTGNATFSAGTKYNLNFVDANSVDSGIKGALLEALKIDSSQVGNFTIMAANNMENADKFNKEENWTVQFDGKTISMKVYPTFGAAIYDKDFDMGEGNDDDIEETSPFTIRTLHQFANLVSSDNGGSGDIDYVTLTHDIDFKYSQFDASGNLTKGSYTPGQTNVHVFDGHGYRLVDFSYSNPSGNASLFTTFRANATFKNFVMYSPDNSAVIEGKNAAGLFAAWTRNVTVTNVAISGYTIKGSDYAGGLLGDVTGTNTVKDCQAVINLVGTGTKTQLGGITGTAKGTIENCYTGGTVKFEGATPTNQASVGGIFGVVGNTSVTVNNCYTYMDLKTTGASANNVYPIGSKTNATITNCSYYKDNFPESNTNATQATALEISGLAVKEGENAAEYSWWPEDPSTATAGYYGWIGNQMGGFPFRAVASYTEDGVKHYVHYGQWPFDAQVMGIAYWELYSDNTVGLQIVGVDKDGNLIKTTDGKIIDTLHRPGPTGTIAPSNEIVSTGYVSFSTIYNMSISLDGRAGTVLTDADKVALIAQALDVQLTGVCTHVSAFTTPEGTGEGEALSATVLGQNLYYSSGFGGVSYDATFGTGTTPFEIRTVAQLDNIPEGSASCFKQTHDLYGETYTSNGTATGDPKYTGAVKFAGTYDGQSYRVLDLEMSGANKNVGLFAEIGTGAKLKNIILYSPNGATISGTGTTGTGTTNDHYGVGGLVGSISSDSSTNKATIENCVVAGYTIEGEQYVGGIVGWGFYGVKITNCAAVNEITCEAGSTNCGVGGILGGYGSNSAEQTEITNCYSGGKITVSGDNASSAVVGGIAGTDGNTSNHALVKNCYTYIDMSGCTTSANVYAISASYNESSSNNYYLNTCVPTSLPVDTNAKGGKAMSNTELAGIFKKASGEYIDGFGEANYTYVPGAGDTGWKPSATAYPFPAVVTVDETDPGGATTKKYVHYGDPPTT